MNRPPPSDVLGRILARSITDDVTGCWTWQGPCLESGYPKMSVWGEQFAHRVAYTAVNGPIPDGLHIDHTCHNRDASCSGGPPCMHRRCVNPQHLDAVTCRTNLLRSAKSTAGAYVRRTECKWGHPFDAENTINEVAPNGQIWRRCRQCKSESRRKGFSRVPIEDAA